MTRRGLRLPFLAATALFAARLAAQAPFGTAFTYQGRLTDGTGLANGTYDLSFTLYDAPIAGSSLGNVTKTGVSVSKGIFTVTLDFGAAAFRGSARWLEIAVQKMGGGYQPLSPRVTVNASPFAQTMYVRTILVKPLGTPADNGSALVSAVNGIDAASATNPWLVKLEAGVYDVGTPGLLVMKPYVDLEGAGEDVTRITATGSGSASATLTCASDSEVRFLTVESTGGGLSDATAIRANNASGSLRHVTARAFGATAQIIGLLVFGVPSPTLTDVTVLADGGAGAAAVFGFATISGSPTLRHVDATATGGFFAQAFLVQGGTADMADLHGVAMGSSSTSIGLTSLSGGSATVRSSAFQAAGSPDAIGVEDAADLTLEDVRAVGTSTGGGPTGGLGIYCGSATLSAFGTYAQGGGVGATFGLSASQSNLTLVGSTFNAVGSPGTGVQDDSSMGGPYTVEIDGSTLQGATNSIVTKGTSTTKVLVGGSHFNGPSSVTAPSTHTCAGSWNGAYGFFASACP